MCQGTIEALIRMGSDTSLLVQKLVVRLTSADSLRNATRVCLVAIPSAYEALCNLGTSFFVVSHFFYMGKHHMAAIMQILFLIGRLEEIHTKEHGMITYPHHIKNCFMTCPIGGP